MASEDDSSSKDESHSAGEEDTNDDDQSQDDDEIESHPKTKDDHSTDTDVSLKSSINDVQMSEATKQNVVDVNRESNDASEATVYTTTKPTSNVDGEASRAVIYGEKKAF